MRGPKGRMKACTRAVRMERLGWWVISIVSFVEGLRGDVVSVLLLLLGRLEDVSRCDVVVVALERCAFLVSSIFVSFLIESIGDCWCDCIAKYWNCDYDSMR
jgi:hypothetical protein